MLLGVLVGVAVPRAGRHSDIHALYLEKINPTVFVGVWMAGSVTQSAATSSNPVMPGSLAHTQR